MEKGSPALTRGVVSSVLWARCSVSGGECQFRMMLTPFAGSILCLSLEAAMWFFDFAPYWRVDKTLKYRLMFAWALFVGVGGIFITGAGVSTVVLSGWMCAERAGPDVWECRGHQDLVREQRWCLAVEL